VTQARDSVNVSLEMSDPATGQNRWAHTFHARSSDVLIMQREAAREIASAMHVTVSADRTARLAEDRQVNPEAYTHYLVGLRLIQRNTAETSRQAEVELRKSVALDSTYAPALAELANVFFFQAWFGTLGDSVARANSTGLMERAQAVDPDNPDMLVARGVYRSTAAWDFVGADADLKRAMGLRPDAYTIDIYGWFLSVTLRSDPGIALVRRAVALEPRVSTYWNDYILVTMGSTDLATARAVADSAIAMDPGFAAHYAPAAWIALAQGRVDAADSLMRRYDLLTSSAPDFWPSLLLAARGRSGEARRALATLEDQRAAAGKRRTESAFAAVYLTLGDTTTALRLMDEAVKRRDIDLLRTFYYPILREFARSPKMAGIRARMGLPH
jgi:Tfp pilus assembly protein PilF